MECKLDELKIGACLFEIVADFRLNYSDKNRDSLENCRNNGFLILYEHETRCVNKKRF
jgi:hypothetical protein